MQYDTHSSSSPCSRFLNHLNLPRLTTSATNWISRGLHKSSLVIDWCLFCCVNCKMHDDFTYKMRIKHTLYEKSDWRFDEVWKINDTSHSSQQHTFCSLLKTIQILSLHPNISKHLRHTLYKSLPRYDTMHNELSRWEIALRTQPKHISF